MVQAGQHMLALVDDLLELQRLEQGRVTVHKQRVLLLPLLTACAEMLGPVAAAAQMELQVACGDGALPCSDSRSRQARTTSDIHRP